MRVLLVTIGSIGDLYPMLSIAKKLREEQHQCVVIGTGNFEQAVNDDGIDFYSIDKHISQKSKDVININKPVDPFEYIAGYYILHMGPGIVDSIMQCASKNNTVIITTVFGIYGARIAGVKLNLPVGLIHLSSIGLRSFQLTGHYEPYDIKIAKVSCAKIRMLLFHSLDYFVIDPQLRPALKSLHQRYDIPFTATNNLINWLKTADFSVALFPRWFYLSGSNNKFPIDWPNSLAITNFPFYKPKNSLRIDDKIINEFIVKNSSAPVVITFGSSVQDGGALYRKFIPCFFEIKRPIIIVDPAHDKNVEVINEGLMYIKSIPYVNLFHRASLIVHHGGIGTIAEALRAGVPQLICPVHSDQFDNARHIVRHGVGIKINIFITSQKLSAVIQYVTQNERDYKLRAKSLSTKVLGFEDDLTKTTNFITSSAFRFFKADRQNNNHSFPVLISKL